MDNDKQYSLIDKKASEWIKENFDKGICTKKFKADFVIDGLCNIKVGDRLKIGEKDIIITIIGKECFPDICELFKKLNKPCVLKDAVAFAKDAKN